MRMTVSIASDPELLKNTWFKGAPSRCAILAASRTVLGAAPARRPLGPDPIKQNASDGAFFIRINRLQTSDEEAGRRISVVPERRRPW